ncbi:MAG TPA: adenylate/guanylate cyclase domain-containing protein, partial [Herpetosiphonaceae bacterium]
PLLLGETPAAGPASELLALLQLPFALPSLMLAPIASRQAVEGALLLGAAAPGSYDADDLRIAGQIAGQLAAARQRTRFALEFRNEHAAVSTLYESLSELSRVLSGAELIERLLQISVLSTGAERGIVLQLDPETGEPQQAISWPQPLAPAPDLVRLAALGFAPRALAARQPILAASAPDEPGWLPPTEADRETRSVLCVPIIHRDQVSGIVTVTHGDFGAFEAEHLSFMETLARQAAIMLDNVRLYEQQNRLLNQYVTPAFATRLMADPLLSSLGGQRQTVTILFADIKDFTSFAERHQPEALVAILNTYLGIAADAVLECGGTLDKFMGDAVMAIFNAPVEQPDHALRAARAALRLQELIEAYHPLTGGQQLLRFRVGLHSGEAVVGNIGTETLRNYTAIGDAVNTAKRIQEQAAAGQVLCSAAVARQLATAATAFVGELELKGKAQPEPVYRLLEA